LSIPVRPGETVLKKLPPVAAAVAPAEPAVADGRVALVFKSKDGTWLDILVDGDRLEFRGTGQPRVAVQPGRHKIEVYAFMGSEPLKSTTIDTGSQKELSIGVDATGTAECYNCAAADAPGTPGN
jgi:hypothetical protein